MIISEKPRQGLQFQSYQLFFIICKAQIGVGALGFQRGIYKLSGHDAWISVILAGLFLHLIMWVIMKTLSHYEAADLYGIHYDMFGKWAGMVLSLIFMLYTASGVVIISMTYIETVQSWIFPDFPSWLLMLLIIILLAYGLTGGIRVIAGLCLFGFVGSMGVLVFFYTALKHAEWSFLLPVMEVPLPKLMQGVIEMALALAGFEVIFFLYPFLRDPSKANRYAQLGLLATNLYCLVVMIVSLVYFSQNQMPKTIWGTLNLLKIIRFPFLERFEYVALPFWMLIIICNMMLSTWVLLRGMKRVFKQNQKWSLAVFCIVLLASSFVFQTREQILQMTKMVISIALYITYLYPLFLFVAVKIVHAIRKKISSANLNPGER